MSSRTGSAAGRALDSGRCAMARAMGRVVLEGGDPSENADTLIYQFFGLFCVWTGHQGGLLRPRIRDRGETKTRPGSESEFFG